MAIPALLPPKNGRVVVRVVKPRAALAPAGAALRPARSPAWQFSLDSLSLGQQQLEQLKQLRTGVGDIRHGIGGLSFPSFPTQISFTPVLNEQQMSQVENLVGAIVQIAENTGAPPAVPVPDEPVNLSALAYEIDSFLSGLADVLFGPEEHPLKELISRLKGVQPRTEKGLRLMLGRGVDEAIAWVQEAADIGTLKGVAPDRLAAEVRRRAALVLSAQHLVAAVVSDEPGAQTDATPAQAA